VFPPSPLVASLIALVTVIGLFLILRSRQKKQKAIISVSLLTIIVPFLGYSFLFASELKLWYLTGIPIAVCLLVALSFNFFIEKFRKLKLVVLLVLLLIFLVNAGPRLKQPFLGYPEGNSGTFKNQRLVIDWIYQDAEGEDFNVYVYTPPIYDFHYQYLFWWYGNKTYHYEPVEYSYLPGKKDYIKYKDYYLPKEHKEKKSPHLFYLILEPESVKTLVLGWMDNFKESKILTKVTLPSQITIEKRIKNEE
ncbi:unnamed protein product, partial [marine sediment metagenome]